MRGQGHTLTHYQLVSGSVITVCTHEKGLKPLKGLISVTYNEPDMITLDDSYEPRAKMPCGHVIS